jgi:hypothetical protein
MIGHGETTRRAALSARRQGNPTAVSAIASDPNDFDVNRFASHVKLACIPGARKRRVLVLAGDFKQKTNQVRML